ncbi:MAG TPA: cysteine desulfurase [Gemmatimonadales bacterium]|nr:cysteine desulfurase [Gemmatimonadales bacterium]
MDPRWRRHFPALAQSVEGQPLTYLDTAATAQRPDAVIEAVAAFYRQDNANPGRALHALARQAHEAYEHARRTVAEFIGAADPLEVVFTRGTTEAINLVATAWGGANLRPGDEVLLTVAEHASAMLPWQLAARRARASLRCVDVSEDGQVEPGRLAQQLTSRTRIVVCTHVSNVLGVINPARELCAAARGAGVPILLDAAQSVPHFPVNVQELGCDFLAFSGHKMMGPMGCGVLWARRSLLDGMPPYQSGSNMAHDADHEHAAYAPGALRFGAGTPSVADAVGLAAAVRFLGALDREVVWRHEQALVAQALDRLGAVPGLRIIGSARRQDRIGVFSFVVDRREPETVLAELDRRGIAIRAGDLASLPLLRRFGVTRAARASLYLYNTAEEVDRLADALTAIAR